jgi:phenylpropionate dioxygenase-like ring-hydroxylating dioxygenase large terminal subunit
LLTDDPQQANGDGAFNANGNGNGRHGHSPKVQNMLDLLVERATRPLEEAKALPPSFYTDQEIYDLEIKEIWRKSWIHVGRVEELKESGDWISRDIAGEPVIVTKGEDGEIRAMSRVCRHRFMDLLDGEAKRCGHAEKLTCPYHLWSYDLDGKFVAAPHMNRSKLFEQEKDGYSLPTFAVHIWQGFIFVNLDADPAPFDEVVTPEAEALLGNYDAADWRLMDRIEWGETAVNWKLVVDNGREAYHHIGTHGESLEPMWPAHMIEFEPSPRNAYFLARMFVSAEAATGQEDGHYISPMMLPPAPGLTPYEKSHSVVLGMYPGFIYVPGPDVILTLSFQPTGLSSHNLDIELLFHKDQVDNPEAQEVLAEYRKWITDVQGEDTGAMKGVQRMLTSGIEHPGGALSHLEVALVTFQRYLAKRLAGESSIPDGPVVVSASAEA